MTDAYVHLVGRMAYVWGYAMVNAHNRREAFRAAPMPGYLGGVLPVAPVGHNQMLTDYVKADQSDVSPRNVGIQNESGMTPSAVHLRPEEEPTEEVQVLRRTAGGRDSARHVSSRLVYRWAERNRPQIAFIK